MSTYSNLKIEEITLGDSGWGTSTTNNLLAIQQALQSVTLVTGDFTSNVATLPWTNTSATTNTPRAMVLNITATLTGAGTVNLPAITGGKAYLVINNSVGGFAVTVKVTGLTGVSVPNGKAMWLWNNGTDVVDGVNYVSSLTLGAALPLTSGGTGQTTANAAFNALAPSQASASNKYLKSDGTNASWDQLDISTADVTGTLPIANGGTGATTAATARTGLGATTLGGNLFTITNPSAVTFPRFNADNTVSALNAADFRTAIGAGSGTGTVTAVTASSPVASSGGTAPDISLNANYGDTLNPYASKTANYVLAAPNGSAGTPSFRALVAADIPTLNQNTTGTAGGLSATLAVTSGGTGSTTAAGARTNLGLGTIATQASSSVSITGGEIGGTAIYARVYSVPDATSITVNLDTTDIATQANTQAAGTLTINAPTAAGLFDGMKFILRIRSTNVQTFSWNAVFAGSTDLALPTATSGSSKYDYLGFIYNTTAGKWQLLAKNFGF